MSSVLAIDAHAHVVDPWRLRAGPLAEHLLALGGTFGPQDLRSELEADGFDGTLLVELAPSTTETRELLSIAAEAPFVLGVIGLIDLTAPDVGAAIADVRAAHGGDRLVAVRHRVHAESDPDWLGRLDVRRGLAAVAAAGLAFDLQVRTRELPAATEVARAMPELRFVLDHLARPPIASGDLTHWGRALLTLAECPNVSATLSGLVSQAAWHTWSIDDLRHPVELAVDAFGPERLMVGSDWPICLLAGTYSDAIDSVRILLAELSTHDQADILGGTATRIYRLDRGAGTGQPGPPLQGPG